VTQQVADFKDFSIIDVPAANISTLKIDQNAIDKISSLAHVDKVVSVTNLAGRVQKQESASTAETIIIGADKDYWDLAGIAADAGKLPEANDEILVNKSVIRMISENEENIIGKNINLVFVIPKELQAGNAVSTRTTEPIPLKVVGISNGEQFPTAIVSQRQLMANGVATFSALKIQVDNRRNVEALRKQLENAGFSTEYIGDTVSEISQVFSFFRVILAAFGIIALIVASLGTFNVLTINLLERIREIGLFKALGMKNKDIYKLFLAESLIIGTCGGFLGLIMGWALGRFINYILYLLAVKTHVEPVSIFVTPWFFAFAVALFAIFVGFITGWYPSKRAVKTDPLDALRYE